VAGVRYCCTRTELYLYANYTSLCVFFRAKFSFTKPSWPTAVSVSLQPPLSTLEKINKCLHFAVCLLGAEFTWLAMLHTLIHIVVIIKTYTVFSRFQKIGTHFVHFTNMRFLYVCLIFYNVLTNVLLPLVLFILRQGSVLLQHVILCAFYRRVAKRSLHKSLHFNPMSLWHKIWFAGMTDQPSLNQKLCKPLLAGLYSSPVTSGDCCTLQFTALVLDM
jgi:hypothetical protein